MMPMPHDREASTFPKMLIFLRALIWAFTAPLLVAMLSLARQDWFGVSDFKPFMICTGFFAALVAVVGLSAFRVLARLPTWLRYIVGGCVGLGTGFVFTVGNSLLLGGWFGAWSIPVFLSWLGGGMLGMAAAAATRPRIGVSQLATETVSFLCLLLTFSVGVPGLVNAMTHNQHLTIVFARWYPDDSPLSVEDPLAIFNQQDRALLKRAGVHGRVVARTGGATYTVDYPKARMIILVSGPVTEPVQLSQPYASNLLYTQDGTMFRRYPPDTRVLERLVKLAPDASRASVTGYRVELASGATHGAVVFDWDSER